MYYYFIETNSVNDVLIALSKDKTCEAMREVENGIYIRYTCRKRLKNGKKIHPSITSIKRLDSHEMSTFLASGISLSKELEEILTTGIVRPEHYLQN